jgi:predicted dienelactone hydrolase
MRKIVLGFGIAVVVLMVAMAVTYSVTNPEPLPPGAPSVRYLQPGAYPVGELELTLVDESRPTMANGDYPGAASRTLITHVWFPDTTEPGDRPLIVYCHGFMSNRFGGRYLAEALAGHGYVVAAADFPLSHLGAPGEPNASDVRNQPGDVSFLIDRLLEGAGADLPGIDGSRIGVAGLSLGGLTATLVGFHPRWRDPRVDAVVSLAGPAALFTPAFYRDVDVPFLMVAGTGDAIVDYSTHAAVVPERSHGLLVTIEGGSHIGFADIAEPWLRLLGHPDSLSCDALGTAEDAAQAPNAFAGLGSLKEGIDESRSRLSICTRPLTRALHAGRQHMITQVAVLSFLDSVLAADPADREAGRRVLVGSLEEDFAEASITL